MLFWARSAARSSRAAHGGRGWLVCPKWVLGRLGVVTKPDGGAR
jgi:hypothetical protein